MSTTITINSHKPICCFSKVTNTGNNTPAHIQHSTQIQTALAVNLWTTTKLQWLKYNECLSQMYEYSDCLAKQGSEKFRGPLILQNKFMLL